MSIFDLLDTAALREKKILSAIRTFFVMLALCFHAVMDGIALSLQGHKAEQTAKSIYVYSIYIVILLPMPESVTVTAHAAFKPVLNTNAMKVKSVFISTNSELGTPLVLTELLKLATISNRTA